MLLFVMGFSKKVVAVLGSQFEVTKGVKTIVLIMMITVLLIITITLTTIMVIIGLVI
jgi:hypothetical protein